MFSFTYIHMSVYLFVIISHLALKKKLAFQEKKKKRKKERKKKELIFLSNQFIFRSHYTTQKYDGT